MTKMTELLGQWAKLEPTVCKTTFMPGTFEIVSPLDWQFLDVRNSFNVGRNTEFERQYLLNAVLECQCFLKDWFVVQSQVNMTTCWTCAIECRKTRQKAIFSAPTRFEAFLRAYLAMLSWVGGKNASACA
jgi:hypothetical protein